MMVGSLRPPGLVGQQPHNFLEHPPTVLINPTGDIDADALGCDRKPDIVQFRFDPRTDKYRHLAASGGLGLKTDSSTLLHIVGELAHGLLSDQNSFAAIQRHFRGIHSCKNLCAGPLSLFPQDQSFSDGVRFAVKASGRRCPGGQMLPDRALVALPHTKRKSRESRCQAHKITNVDCQNLKSAPAQSP
jgi:hypothetical protein